MVWLRGIDEMAGAAALHGSVCELEERGRRETKEEREEREERDQTAVPSAQFTLS